MADMDEIIRFDGMQHLSLAAWLEFYHGVPDTLAFDELRCAVESGVRRSEFAKIRAACVQRARMWPDLALETVANVLEARTMRAVADALKAHTTAGLREGADQSAQHRMHLRSSRRR
jgi:hypothetical protein